MLVNGDARTRLFDVWDVCLFRLWLRIVHDTVQPQWVPGAVLAQHRDDLRDIFERRLHRVLVMRGARARIVTPGDAASGHGEHYALADVPAGVLEAMLAIRRRKPEVWSGCAYSSPSQLVTSPSSRVALALAGVVP